MDFKESARYTDCDLITVHRELLKSRSCVVPINVLTNPSSIPLNNVLLTAADIKICVPPLDRLICTEAENLERRKMRKMF